MKTVDFGTQLFEIRNAKGLTQEEVADLCNISARTIQRIESGKVQPRAYTIKVISEALGFDFFKETVSLAEALEESKSLKLNKPSILWFIKDLFNLKTNTMKKVSILTTLCLIVGVSLISFKSEIKAQGSKKNKVFSYSEIENDTNHSGVKKGRIQVAFTGEQTLENLVSIKNNLEDKGIKLNFREVKFDENGLLQSIDYDVDCNDGFKGRYSINQLNSINKDKRIGFYRDYSETAEVPFFVGKLKKVIVIDVGHGGVDPGNISSESKEKDIVLKIAEKVKSIYKESGFEILMTRTSDDFKSLGNRVKFINNLSPEFVISLHTHMVNDLNTHGLNIFVARDGVFKEQSNNLAKKMSSTLEGNFKVNEIKNANFKILKNINCPGVLIDLGNMMNAIDKDLLLTEKGQNKIAEEIVKTIK
ncbi:N-acetylmuramoyl-L-alanine amidase [Aestuariibaculum sediminum]|uniref:N-acetylmuramoyl-L-alanine amidase n=1 Tax=Aestuariibaculum sediminum TaxID=2770637 RepID=A0A8J6Q7K9_9FLAO|nr:N-acetylmuramoyl-L-alanine amidase [Aestuariibaculum sediminum]MBD0832653.1 N-acetylmuramoyl-L-alanine amidase [Aestuariibaculum sediminum]